MDARDRDEEEWAKMRQPSSDSGKFMKMSEFLNEYSKPSKKYTDIPDLDDAVVDILCAFNALTENQRKVFLTHASDCFCMDCGGRNCLGDCVHDCWGEDT
jgi:hypothetical protein